MTCGALVPCTLRSPSSKADPPHSTHLLWGRPEDAAWVVPCLPLFPHKGLPVLRDPAPSDRPPSTPESLPSPLSRCRHSLLDQNWPLSPRVLPQAP